MLFIASVVGATVVAVFVGVGVMFGIGRLVNAIG